MRQLVVVLTEMSNHIPDDTTLYKEIVAIRNSIGKSVPTVNDWDEIAALLDERIGCNKTKMDQWQRIVLQIWNPYLQF